MTVTVTLRSTKGSPLTNAEVDANFSALAAAVNTGGGGGSAGVASFNSRTGAVTLTSADVVNALGYTPGTGSGGSGGVSSFNSRTGAITLTSADVVAALGFTPGTGSGGGSAGVSSFNSRTGAVSLTSSDVTTALGFTPASSTSAGGVSSFNTRTGAISLTASDVATAGGLVFNTPTNGLTVKSWPAIVQGTVGVLFDSSNGSPALAARNHVNGGGSAFWAVAGTNAAAQYAVCGVSESASNTNQGNAVVTLAYDYTASNIRAGLDAQVCGAGTSSSYGGSFTWSDQSSIAQIWASGTRRQAILATSTYGCQLINGSYSPFTGSHDALISKTAQQPIPGDIVCDHAPVHLANVNDAITEVQLSSAPKQSAAVGVFAHSAGADAAPAALCQGENNDVVATNEQVSSALSIDTQFAHYRDTHNFILINSVGEGGINVCGENGNIEIGDLIVTSSTPGKGMKQDDDLVRSSTVAKARERVVFTSPSDTKMISCIYMCG